MYSHTAGIKTINNVNTVGSVQHVKHAFAVLAVTALRYHRSPTGESTQVLPTHTTAAP